jgi:transposase
MDEFVNVERAALAAREGVEALLRRRDLVPRVRERLEMVKAAALGQNFGSIARWSGRSEQTVRHWLRRFAAGGAAALADAPRAGRPPVADAAYLAALEAAVTASPRQFGLPFDVWTSHRLAAYLQEQTGKRLAAGWLRALLARQQFASGRPKHSLTHLQDADAVAAGEQALAAVEKKGGGRPRGAGIALSR